MPPVRQKKRRPSDRPLARRIDDKDSRAGRRAGQPCALATYRWANEGISAASAVSAKGAFWFATYAGGLNGTLFVTLLRRMMRGRRKPLHLIVDGLPAHKTRAVRDYVDELRGKLTLHFLPGYAPDLNPDELVWSYAKRTGHSRRPLRAGERLADLVHTQLADIARRPALVRSFFRHPSVADISDC